MPVLCEGLENLFDCDKMTYDKVTGKIRKKKRTDFMKCRILKLMTFVLLVAGLGAITRHVAASRPEEQTIYEGVYLDGAYVGGMTRDEAIAAYEKYMDGLDDLKLTFTTSLGQYTTSLKELHVSVSVEDAVDQALRYGRQGNILYRYKEIRVLEDENVVLVPQKRFDKGALRNKLESEASDLVKEAKNATLIRQDGEFVVSEGQAGTRINVDDTVKEVEDLFAGEWKQQDVKLAAVVEEEQPRYTAEDFSKVDSVMGSAETGYNAGNTNRAQNLVTGAGKISGTVLMPGEQFSVYNTVSPFTEENGYANAGQYVNNELVDGLGGGICQVSTTLYNAVVKAELQIDERYPHSLRVGYVDASRDAAIAGTYMDFKFTNNTEYPIYIDGYAGGGSISFAIYGHDERPANRTIELESKIIETYEPGDPQEIKDDTLPEGTRVVEQEAHTGYYAELWKNIYVDGVLTDSVRVNTSKYTAQAAKVRVGTKKVETKADTKDKDEDEEDEDEADDKKDKKTKDKGKNTTEAVTTEAVTTEASTEAQPEPSESEGE
ncbi:MAG: VanW family protein [Lachnospiraceae bacterium]|nr:VanW family protein [Lachnospiraceae bacterium]